MKKADLAVLAERKVAGTGWLPAPLRIAGGATADDENASLEAAE